MTAGGRGPGAEGRGPYNRAGCRGLNKSNSLTYHPYTTLIMDTVYKNGTFINKNMRKKNTNLLKRQIRTDPKTSDLPMVLGSVLICSIRFIVAICLTMEYFRYFTSFVWLLE